MGRFYPLILSTLIFGLSACNFNVTTAHIENVKMCTEIKSNECTESIFTFQNTAQNICISCELENDPGNTLVTFIWKYNNNGEFMIIDEVTLNSSNKGTQVNLQSSLSRPYNGWPSGVYEVEIIIEDSQKEPVIQEFVII